MELGSIQSEGSVPPSKKRSRVHSITEVPSVLYDVVIARRMLMIVWMTVGIIPLLLQGRSYWKFVTPHKLTEYLVIPDGIQREVNNTETFCPVEGVFVSHAWWNIEITHYYTVGQRQICHFVIPQYNIHGAYILGTKKVEPFSTTPESCANDSFYFEHYFYHGSLGYYAFYEEGVGTFCNLDKTAYVRVRGVGTLDINGARLAHDTGDFGYRCSYWYGLFGAVWICYRTMMLRKSYILCKQYGRRCDRMNEKLRRKNAVVFMQECMRLSAHGTTNYHRLVMMYLLLESLMSDLFLLIAQDGILSRLQYLSLGYNLAGVLSMLFEIFESMHWVKENTRLLLKRLLFSYETSLLGEFLSAGLMQHYLTWINRSSLRRSGPTALAVSYYVWSLIGHGIIVLGLTGFVICIRVTSVAIYTWWAHRTLKVLTASCCVDTTLGIRSKMILLGGYLWEEGKLYYKVDALKSFGILKMVEKDGTEFFVIRTVHWIRVPRHDLLVIGQVIGNRVEPCRERLCTGRICLFDQFLGGDLNQSNTPRNRIIRVDNRVAAGPQPLSVLPSYKIATTTASKAKTRHPARINRQSSYQKH